MVARKTTTNGNGKADMTVAEIDNLVITPEIVKEVVKPLEQVTIVESIARPTENVFAKLRSIDVGEHIEKKNGLSYLSWAYAVDMLFQHDPDANWEFLEPTVYPDGSMMMWCVLTAFGKTTKMHLPILDYKNKPIANPNSFQMNTAMMRCLAKAIAVGTGIGLYIYRGEDLPVDDTKANEDKQKEEAELLQTFTTLFEACDNLDDLKQVWTNTPENLKPKAKAIKDARKAIIEKQKTVEEEQTEQQT